MNVSEIQAKAVARRAEKKVAPKKPVAEKE